MELNSVSEKYLITAKDNAKATEFTDCCFVNCNYLLDMHEDIQLNYCTVDGVCVCFINMSEYENANIRLCNCVINDKRSPDTLIDQEKRDRRNMIEGDSVHLTECLIAGDLTIDSAETAYKIENYRSALIEAKNIVAQNTQFVGVKTLLEANKVIVSHCGFTQCCGAVLGRQYRSKIDVIECSFAQCTQIGYGSGGDVKYAMCQFNDCYNRLIAYDFVGGVVVDLCKFNRWTTKKHEKMEIILAGLNGPINLSIRKMWLAIAHSMTFMQITIL